MIAFALSMDAFSLGDGVGMVGIRLREIVKVSITIGLFHMAMPLVGIVVGVYLSELVGDIAVFIGGGVLMAIGVHMLWNGFRTWRRKECPADQRIRPAAVCLQRQPGCADRRIFVWADGSKQVYGHLLFGLMGGVMAYLRASYSAEAWEDGWGITAKY